MNKLLILAFLAFLQLASAQKSKDTLLIEINPALIDTVFFKNAVSIEPRRFVGQPKTVIKFLKKYISNQNYKIEWDNYDFNKDSIDKWIRYAEQNEHLEGKKLGVEYRTFFNNPLFSGRMDFEERNRISFKHREVDPIYWEYLLTLSKLRRAAERLMNNNIGGFEYDNIGALKLSPAEREHFEVMQMEEFVEKMDFVDFSGNPTVDINLDEFWKIKDRYKVYYLLEEKTREGDYIYKRVTILWCVRDCY